MRKPISVGDTIKIHLRDWHGGYTVPGKVIAIPSHRRFFVVEYRIDCGMFCGVRRFETARAAFPI